VEKTYSLTPIDHLKLYAHALVVDAKEYRCLELLWTRESNWNYKAKNKRSSAKGIPQLLNLKTNDPIEQINLGIKYIKHRYGTNEFGVANACGAWAHWQKNKHY
jgi:SLT domain-containing protein